MKNIFLLLAGVINLFTALLHAIGGQIDLINPLMDSNLQPQATGELVAVWHIVTILLFASSFVLIQSGTRQINPTKTALLRFIGVLYILIGIPFIATSIWFSIFAPQWILLVPIGALTLIGYRKSVI